MKRRRALLCVCAAVALMVLVGPAPAVEEGTDEARSPTELFAQGNRLYEAGDYEGAVEAYSALVRRGAVDKDLFYNLGNACYKAGAVGHAVLFYERALRLAPRDEDVASNLALVRALLHDQQLAAPSGWLSRAVRWLPGRLSSRELVVVASALFLVLAVLSISFVFRDTRAVRQAYGALSFASPGRLLGVDMTQDFVLAMCVVFSLFLVSAGVAGARYRGEVQRREAVVLVPEVSVYSGPSTDATLQFKIHEGTTVRISRARSGWLEVELPGDLSGWIAVDAVERI